MPRDALGAEGNGSERVLDLVRHLLCNFFPRQLPLRAKELRSVFDDQDRACLLAASEIEPRAGDGQVQGAAVHLNFNLSRRRAHTIGAADHSGQLFGALGSQQRLEALPGQTAHPA